MEKCEMKEEHLIEKLIEINEKQVKAAQIKYYIVCGLLAVSLIGNFILMSLSRTSVIDLTQANEGEFNTNEVKAD